MSRPTVYTDAIGRIWAKNKLDDLMRDQSVLRLVQRGARVGSRPDRDRWIPGAVLAWARGRYAREEAAALLLLLVTRFFDVGLDPFDSGSQP